MNSNLTISDHAMIKLIVERILREATGPEGMLRHMITEIVTDALQDANSDTHRAS